MAIIKTQAGAAHYLAPIGTPIGRKTKPPKPVHTHIAKVNVPALPPGIKPISQARVPKALAAPKAPHYKTLAPAALHLLAMKGDKKAQAEILKRNSALAKRKATAQRRMVVAQRRTARQKATAQRRAVTAQKRAARLAAKQQKVAAQKAQEAKVNAEIAAGKRWLASMGFSESDVDLTADTAKASTVHHPLGRPGGPGLFHVKGLQLPAYIQNVAHAMKRQGKDTSRAIQMAIGIVRNWAHGHDGHGHAVSPEVQAAAVKAIAEYDAARVRAKADNAGEHEEMVDLSYVGFKKLHASLVAKGHSPEAAARIAAAVGRKKYGAKAFGKMAGKGIKAPAFKHKKASELSNTAMDLAFGTHAHKQNMNKSDLQMHLGDEHGLRVDDGATRGRMAAMHKMCHSPF